MFISSIGKHMRELLVGSVLASQGGKSGSDLPLQVLRGKDQCCLTTATPRIYTF